MDKKSDKISGAFLAAKKQAEKLAKDNEATGKLLASAKKKAEQNKNFAKRLRDDLYGMFRMTKQWSLGNYSVPWKTIVTAVAALIYFVNPIDLIPDFIIGTGLLDDASVLAYALNIIRKDVHQFLEWEKSTDGPKNKEPG